MEVVEKPSAEWTAWAAAEGERMGKILLYSKALVQLATEQRIWVSNQRAFSRWEPKQQTRWIKHIEQQAQAGLPMAEELMTRALAIRMGGS